MLAWGKRATVINVKRDDSETFELTPTQEDELVAALGEADRGEGMDAEEFLASLLRSIPSP